MHQIWETPQLEDTKVGHCIYLSSILLSLTPCTISSAYWSLSANQSLSSFVSHFPILRSILLPSPSYYHYLHSFFLSCSVLPRWLTVQTRRGKLGCSHNDRPFVLICSSSSSIKVSTQASNTHKQTHAHKHLQCLKLEETCFGPKPSKLITLPWWSGPVNLTRLQCWRETERIPFWEYLRSF